MFKDSIGRWRTKSLFYEINDYRIDEGTIFTITESDKEVNGVVLKSLRKLFVESEDPTGYTTATEHLGGYAHWEALCKSSLKGEIEKWKIEMEVRIRSLGLKQAITSAKSGNFNAAKFLAERGWDKRTAGRPSTEEVVRETKVQAQLFSEVENDLMRMELLNGEKRALN